LQHATFSIPNYREGYTTDDNARALIVSVLLEESGHKKSVELASRYLGFLWYAFDIEHKWFRNFMDYGRNWLEVRGSEDSQGRALWALGTVLNRSHTPPLHDLAGRIFEQSLLGILETTSPRAWSFGLLGLNEYLQRFEGDRRAHLVQEELAQRLLNLFDRNSSSDWCWFEPALTYCNATIARALLLSGASMNEPNMTRAGLDALTWLMTLQCADGPHGHFVPIGSNGFYPRSAERARFDQQPVEAQATVSACLDAFRITGHKDWQKQARNVFEWFLGNNDLNIPLYDPTTGGCRDGLHPDRPNENQGAESTLAFLQALLELRLAENNIPSGAYTFDEQPTLAALPAPQTQSHFDRR
jgi:hypothetical protein